MPFDLSTSTNFTTSSQPLNEHIYIKKFVDYVRETTVNITEEMMFDWLKIKQRWPWNATSNILLGEDFRESVCVLTNVGMKTNSFYSTHNNIGLYLDFDKWFWFHERGFLTTISDVLDLNQDLRNIEEKGREILGFSIFANFYFARKSNVDQTTPSFAPHKHFYPVVIKQIYGESLWLVNSDKFTLKPQEILYIPRDTEHAVLENSTDKLSLTLNLNH